MDLLNRHVMGRPARPRGPFGEALCQARHRAGLTQEEVGRLFGRHRVTIARYEAGRIVPAGDDIRGKLAILERMAR